MGIAARKEGIPCVQYALALRHKVISRIIEMIMKTTFEAVTRARRFGSSVSSMPALKRFFTFTFCGDRILKMGAKMNKAANKIKSAK